MKKIPITLSILFFAMLAFGQPILRTFFTTNTTAIVLAEQTNSAIGVIALDVTKQAANTNLSNLAAGNGTVFTNVQPSSANLFLLSTNNGVNITNLSAASMSAYNKATLQMFNVKDYGANGDGSIGTIATNDGVAIQAAIYAAGLAGGGTVFFPDGTYNISLVPFTFTTAYGPWPAVNSGSEQMKTQLHFPMLDLYTNAPICIILKGAHTPAPNLTWNQGVPAPIPTNGSIILSSRSDGNVGNCCVIGEGVSTNDSAGWQINGMYLRLENLIIRTKNDPNYKAVDLHIFGYAAVKDCAIDIGISSGMILQPVNGAIGLLMPNRYNWCISEIDGVFIMGYNTGLSISEHFTGNNIRIEGCFNGLQIGTADHTITINHLLEQACTRNIVCVSTSKTPITIANFSTEHTTLTSGQAWQTCTNDLYDPSSYLHGSITYATIVSNIGMTNDWNQIGGTNIDTVSIYDGHHDFVKSQSFVSSNGIGISGTFTVGTNILYITNGLIVLPP